MVASGLILVAALGPAAMPMGVFCIATGTLLPSLLGLLPGANPQQAVSASSSAALVIGGVFAGLAAQGAVPAPGMAMAIIIAVSLGCALLQTLASFLGIARLAPLTPYPVVSGLVNATAVLLILSQLRAASDAGGLAPEPILVAALTCGLSRYPPLRTRFLPPMLLALGAGTLLHHALAASGWQRLGPTMAALPAVTVQLDNLAAGYRTLAVGNLPWPVVASTAATLAFLGVLDTLGVSVALSDLGGPARAKFNLRFAALSNIVVALAGGAPASGTMSSTLLFWRLGVRDWRAPAVRVLAMLLFVLALGRVLPWIPRAALAGLVIAGGIGLLDRELPRLLRRTIGHPSPHRGDILASVAVSAVVVVSAVLFGLAAAVGVGTIAALLAFAAEMSQGAVRRVHAGGIGLSRVRRGPEATRALLEARGTVAVVELSGPMFFGSVDQAAQALDRAFAAGARRAIIDVSRVDRIDLSGARRLLAVAASHRGQERGVAFAPMHPGLPVADYLEIAGLEPGETYRSMPDALAALEDAALADMGSPSGAGRLTPARALAMLGVPEQHVAAILRYARVESVAQGVVFASQGDAAAALFVICEGDVEARLRAHGASLLLSRVSVGAMVGEMGVLLGETRGADLVAVTACRLLAVTAADYVTLKAEAPGAAVYLAEAMASNIALNLRIANLAIQALED